VAEDQEALFTDKIRLAMMVLDKEGQLIGAWASLLKDIKAGDVGKVGSLWNNDGYINAWRVASELYYFLKYNKLEQHKAKVEYDFLNKSMQVYEDDEDKLDIGQLRKVIDQLLKLVSLSGYHEDTYKISGGRLEDEE